MLQSTRWDLRGWFRAILCHKPHQSKSLRSRFFNGFKCPSEQTQAFKCHENLRQFSHPHKEKCGKNILLQRQKTVNLSTISSFSQTLPKIGEVAESHALLYSKCENTSVSVLSQTIHISGSHSINKATQILHGLHTESGCWKFK